MLQDEEAVSKIRAFERDLDILWVLVGSYMVFFMQAGFAMLEAGTVRKQNTMNILVKVKSNSTDGFLISLQNLLDSCLAALMWWAIGYPLAFGDGANDNGFIGGSHFFMIGKSVAGDDRQYYAHWIFQWAFAATSATIVSGAAAERCRYRAYAVYTLVITGFVFPVVVHWVWSDHGWLAAMNSNPTFEGSLGLMDWAGSSVVHVTGGGAAFFAAYFLGPRVGRFDEEGKVVDIRASSQSLIMLGTFVLWFGWYSFNSVSGLCVKDCMITAAQTAVNTTLSASSGSLTVLLIHLGRGNRIQIAPLLNGLLSGLVGITAGCAVVEPFAAVIIGGCCGTAYYYSALWLLRQKIDDPLDASCVHFCSGVVGTIAVGFFATETNVHRAYHAHLRNRLDMDIDFGVIYGGDGRQLSVQLLGTLVIAAWTCVINFVLFFILYKVKKLRIPPEEEMKRLEASRHGDPVMPGCQRVSVEPNGNNASANPSRHNLPR